jgi:plasmid maintenance system killer protein
LEVLFADPRLRDLCKSARGLQRRYGLEGAKKVGQRLQALRMAESLDDVMCGPGRCHPLKGPYYEECYSLSLHAGWRLIFRLMTANERTARGVTDEMAALVVEIIDYHDG